MDDKTRTQLNQINREFYTITANDFSATRGQAWVGWEPLQTIIAQPIHTLLDVGCGNGRFAMFWSDHQVQPFTYHGVDNNPKLLSFARDSLNQRLNVRVKLTEQDVIDDNVLSEEQYDLVVLFGVIHHVPGFEERREFIKSLAQRVNQGGYLVFAEWRFYEQERFRKRIVKWDDDITVEQHDYLLDWRRGDPALRYCHYVDDDEHATLIEASGLQVVADYRADGSTGDLNRYCVLRNI